MAVLAARCRAIPHGSAKVVAELAGLRAETLSRWGRGQGNPRLGELEALAEALDVSVSYLICDDREEKPRYPETGATGSAERKIENLLARAEQVSAELAAQVAARRGHR